MSLDQIEFQSFAAESHAHLIEPLTVLLHEAYAPLAARGMKYLATHQPSSETLDRLLKGESYLAFFNDELIGSVSLYREREISPCHYYTRQAVFSFGQFAVQTRFQGRGFGSLMMDKIEARARELGARELALDTSENAHELIQMYKRRGYAQVSTVQWEVTNYLSVVMSKSLSGTV